MTFPPSDPLKIYYLVVLAVHKPEDMTAFQGFSPSWAQVDWALMAMSRLPCDVLEGEAPQGPLNGQRMGGARGIDWTPVDIAALEALDARPFALFTVAFTGDAATAARVEAWRDAIGLDLLHVSTAECGRAIAPADLSEVRLIAHCREVFACRRHELDPLRRTTTEAALTSWAPRPREPLPLIRWGHNTVIPNWMSLERAGYELAPGEPFVGTGEADYDRVIVESARAVMAARERSELLPISRMTLIRPETYLVEPALFRQAYSRLRRVSDGDLLANKVIRHLQTQRGFLIQGDSDFIEAVSEPGVAGAILLARQSELNTFMAGVSLTAAQTLSATLRLSPAINHVFPAMKNFARSIRSSRPEHRLKQPRLFELVQTQLAAAIGPERVNFIKTEVAGPVKIISDAPVEWLPINGLPLMMRFQTSRLNATPGNLLMGELARGEGATLLPGTLCDILVVTAFAPGDQLRRLLRRALEALRESWRDRVRITFADTTTVQGFEAALNAFHGAILIFDGHGARSAADGDGIGRLMFGNTGVDILALRGRVRVPPIVILSACDTQSLDSPSHATVANGFLALGAITVTATLLPVGGFNSAQFIGRLVYRLAEFVPAALAAHHRVLNWTEVISGMQRMYLASELLDVLVGRLDRADSQRTQIQTDANVAINSGDPEWYDRLLAAVASHLCEPLAAVEKRARATIARSEAIRYFQLGRPENLLIDDGSIRDSIVPPHMRHYGAMDEGPPV